MDTVEKWGEELKNLHDSYDSLASFSEISAWLEKAKNILRETDDIRNKMSQDAAVIKADLTNAENDRNNKSFFKRNFGSRKEELELDKKFKVQISVLGDIDKTITKIKEQIEGLPNNKNEQSEMLNRFKLQKKELNIQVREVNENMRQVHASVRTARANWAGVRGKGIVGTSARIARASITQSKDEALRPLDAKKAELEYKLASVEREELKISRISGGDELPHLPHRAIKCKYCGRELGIDSVCLGCGAAN